jgi:hypothetical protein
LLVVNDTDTSSLTPEQVQALNTWISQGGRFVVGGGAGAQRTASGLSTQFYRYQTWKFKNLRTCTVWKITSTMISLFKFLGRLSSRLATRTHKTRWLSKTICH